MLLYVNQLIFKERACYEADGTSGGCQALVRYWQDFDKPPGTEAVPVVRARDLFEKPAKECDPFGADLISPLLCLIESLICTLHQG